MRLTENPDIDQECLGIAKNVFKKLDKLLDGGAQLQLIYGALKAVKDKEHERGRLAVRTARESMLKR
jgi:hypothetical protein